MIDYPTLDDIIAATGSDFCYSYSEIRSQASVADVQRYCTHARKHFAPIARKFNVDENSRWCIRYYLAIKYVAASALLGGSSIYAKSKNLNLGVPYFNYYSVLSACRAFLLTHPLIEWGGAKTVEMTHQNILNRTADLMRELDPSRREEWHKKLLQLRETRELFSYRFPLSGSDFVSDEAIDPIAATDLARLIAELASLNTECLQASLRKHSSQDLKVMDLPDHVWATAYQLSGADVHDKLDRYRFRKIVSRGMTVSTLEVMTSDGLFDDLYGSWSDSEELASSDAFDPDTCSRLILAL